MLSLVLRKRVAELAGVTQAELEQRFDIGAPRRPSQPAPVRSIRPGADPYGKLLERVLAEPRLLRELDSADLPRPRQPGAEAAALLDLIEQSHAVPGELSVAGAIELLRARGHDAVLQRLLPVAHDLQALSPEELAVEVRAYVVSLQAGAQRDEMTRTVAGVSSPGELSENDRALVARALAPAKLVERDH
jgi:hypothetical protein